MTGPATKVYKGSTQAKLYVGSIQVLPPAGPTYTYYRLWNSVPSPLPSDFDEPTSQISLGTEFYVTSAADLVGISYLQHSSNAPLVNLKVALYQVNSDNTGILIDSWDATTVNHSAFAETMLPTPMALTVNQRYKAVLYMDQAHYKATGSYWVGSGPGASGITSGPLTAPSGVASTAGNQGSFFYSDRMGFPNAAFNSGNYWVQPIVRVAS